MILTMNDVIGALARGYCTKRNESKALDANLVNDMAKEILKLIKKEAGVKKGREER